MNVFRRAAALCLVTVVLAGVVLGAHEIGTTRVSARFENGGRYDVEIVTDAASLVEKLDTLAGAPASPPAADAAALGLRLSAHDGIFRQRVAVAFDGAGQRPAIHYVVTADPDDPSAMVATIRLTGAIPTGARQFTWTYGWTFTSYALSATDGRGAPATEWLEGSQTSSAFPLAAPPPPVSRARIAWQYLVLGFTHIVPHGLDHVLFVLGIFLLSRRLKSVLAQVTAFTVAHSVTLGLSIYGVIEVPSAIVEPLIAVSIAYVAIENLLETELKSRRLALVFAFGLLHGRGFAGVLQELGLPRSEFLTALLTFNAGVEAGQLAVIAAAFALGGWQWGTRVWYRPRVVVPASLFIACVAVYWTVERIVL